MLRHLKKRFRWTLKNPRKNTRKAPDSLTLVPQVLNTVAYVWNDNGAQIVFLVLNPVEYVEDGEEGRKMIDLGRHMITMNAAFSGDVMCGKKLDIHGCATQIQHSCGQTRERMS